MPQEFATIALPELLGRLAAGHAERIAVITPNRRLAAALQRTFDAVQVAAQRTSWEAPDILPYRTFLARCHEDARYGPFGEAVPMLLSDAEAQWLWEDALRHAGARDRILSVPATAALASSAWALAHAWRIAGALDGTEGNEDAEAFASWRAAYVRRTSSDGFIDAARLPEWVAHAATSARFPLPKTLVAFAFDLLTPQQADLLEAFARAGVEVVRGGPRERNGSVRRTTFANPREELEQAARWARSRLEAAQGAACGIAVVVPDLATRRAQVERAFERVLPGLYNVSLGEPLAGQPLVDAALAVLEISAGPVPYERASRLLRSPFLAGAERESLARARADAALRRTAPAVLSLARLRSLLPQAIERRGGAPCPRLLALVDTLIAAGPLQGRAPPHEWARRFTALLEAAGFPGERGLDSEEYQALARWRETVAQLATLDSVAPSWSASEARSRLQRLCAEAIFQPASGDAPVQVLGILESAGLEFDHLWVSGLTEEAWPLPARPHAFIPPALQRRAGIPQALPETSLAVDRALTQRWRRAAGEVVFTNARAEGDRELLPSPLVADIVASPVEALHIPAYPTLREALFAAGREPDACKARPDAVAPAIGTEGAQGGTGILADQAACPFRAFAHYRLAARALERPEPALGPAERGQLLHAMMARIWGVLHDHATLVATDEARLRALADEAAAHAIGRVRLEAPGRLEGRFAELERERLAGLALDWLAIERGRAPFEVRMSEAPMTLSAGNLRLEGRVDRIDRLADGGLAVLDYKTGQVRVASWLGPRPDDAQLPLYALAAGDEEVRAVAFAQLRTGQMKFVGVARDEGVLPGVPPVERHVAVRKFAGSWPQLQAAWREQVDRLGEDYASGDARIDPKHAGLTCERCDLKPLCRVHERATGLPETIEDDE